MITTDPPDATPRHAMVPIPSGVTLHVVHWDRAAGPEPELATFVLVHGLASNARLWDGVGRRLATLGHGVVAIDQRGHGLSSKPDTGYDMTTVADDLDLLIDELGFDRPVVAGQSWGGNVVLEFAVRHPTHIRAIVCVDGGFIDLATRFPDWDDASVAPRSAEARRDARWSRSPRGSRRPPPIGPTRDAPERSPTSRSATTARSRPWLTFDRHIDVLRGLWDHQPSSRYGESLFRPAHRGRQRRCRVERLQACRPSTPQSLRSRRSCRMVQPGSPRCPRPAARRRRRPPAAVATDPGFFDREPAQETST